MHTQNLELSGMDVYGSDPLARFLIGRWKIWPIGLAFFIFLWSLFFLFLLPAVFGFLFPSTDIVRNSLADYYNQINFLIIFPTVAYYYLAQPQIVIRIYNIVLRYVHDSDRASSLSSYVREQHAKNYWVVPGILFALLGMGLGAYDNVTQKLGIYWYAANWFMIFLMQLTRGLVFYILFTVAIRHLVASTCLNKIFQRTESLIILTSTKQNTIYHAINNYAFSFSSIVAVAGLSLGLQPILSNPPYPEYYIFVAVYFVLAPVSFFLPIWQLHKEMTSSRSKILDNLNAKLQAEFKEFVDSFDEKAVTSAKKSEAISMRLKLIREAIELAEKSPKWPFDVNTIYKLGVTVISPFLITIINRIVELGVQLLDSIID